MQALMSWAPNWMIFSKLHVHSIGNYLHNKIISPHIALYQWVKHIENFYTASWDYSDIRLARDFMLSWLQQPHYEQQLFASKNLLLVWCLAKLICKILWTADFSLNMLVDIRGYFVHVANIHMHWQYSVCKRISQGHVAIYWLINQEATWADLISTANSHIEFWIIQNQWLTLLAS